jgi:hypothetical protein
MRERLLTRRRGIIAAGAAVGVLLASGIGVLVARATGGNESATTRPKVTVGVEQYRDDEPAHTLQIAVRDHEAARTRVLAVQFVSQDFEPTGPVSYDERLPTGGLQIDFKTPFGKGRCDGKTVPARARPAKAVLRLQTAGGSVENFTYPLPDPKKLLDRLLIADCRLALVANVAHITFGEGWTVARRGTEPVLHGTVEVRRTNLDRSLAVTNVLGSVLFKFELSGRRPLATLPPGETAASFPLTVTTPRCTGHSFGESKQTYYFRLWVRIDNGEEIGITFVPDDRAKEALHNLLTLCDTTEVG